jgi:class 3 adenylate cyclase
MLCIECDPIEVFLRVAHLIADGAKLGYLDESLGAEQGVKFIERSLAEYREVFRSNETAVKR